MQEIGSRSPGRLMLGLKDVENFPFVEPPDSRAINDGVTLLRELGALSAARPQEESGGEAVP